MKQVQVIITPSQVRTNVPTDLYNALPKVTYGPNGEVSTASEAFNRIMSLIERRDISKVKIIRLPR